MGSPLPSHGSDAGDHNDYSQDQPSLELKSGRNNQHEKEKKDRQP